MRKWWKARFCDQTSLRLVSNVIHGQEHKLIFTASTEKKKRSLKRKKTFNNVPGGTVVVGGRAEEEMK